MSWPKVKSGNHFQKDIKIKERKKAWGGGLGGRGEGSGEIHTCINYFIHISAEFRGPKTLSILHWSE